MIALVTVLAASSSNAAAFWAVCVIGLFAFAWIAGIAEIAGTPEEGFATGTRTTWLLLVIFTGIIGLIAYVLVGKKRGSWASKKHRVLIDPRDNMYWCTDCDFASYAMKDVRAHGISSLSPITRGQRPNFAADDGATPTPSLPVTDNAVGRGEVVTTPDRDPEASDPSATPEMKTCPDCAEEVRAAARKCRFCGYMFEPADLSG